MNAATVYEFDALGPESAWVPGSDIHVVPDAVYSWLEDQCLACVEQEGAGWLRLAQRRGRRVVQVTSFVGALQAPNGYQIEVLPKVGRVNDGGPGAARQLLVDMLSCLREFRHIRTGRARIAAAQIPLFEVFIAEFLRCTDEVVKRGLRGDYVGREGNLFALRGKLQFAQHVRRNICRADRFFVAYDEFSVDRAENRLIAAALDSVTALSRSQVNQQLARELRFVFADIPASVETRADFQRVRPDRGMVYYADALAWARLILESDSPVAGSGNRAAPSLMFPMDALFEAFVAKHVGTQVISPLRVKAQAQSLYLVRHRQQDWFRLKPDLLVRGRDDARAVLDTKWKLLDSGKDSAADKYGLSQGDFYQMYAYGQTYLRGQGDVLLVYPKTTAFARAPQPFAFPSAPELRLWIVPFCLSSKRLLLPDSGELGHVFAQ